MLLGQTDLANSILLDNHVEPALFQCWHTVYDAGPTFGQWCRITMNARCTCQQTRDVDSMLFQCWADVGYGRPTLKQLWIIVSCLQGVVPYTCYRSWCVVYTYAHKGVGLYSHTAYVHGDSTVYL